MDGPISKIIQNFDQKCISGHVLSCTQDCHLNSNSTHGAGGGAIEKSSSNDNMEIDDDEDFDLETPHSSKTQSLGNSGVTITPISHLNKVPFIDYVSTFIAKKTQKLNLTP